MIEEKALELGRLLGQTEDFKALKRAQDEIEEASELRAQLGRLQELSDRMQRGLLAGEDPPEELVKEYDALVTKVQVDARYQRMVAAQSNFEKLMHRANEKIAEGLRKGSESPIITLG